MENQLALTGITVLSLEHAIAAPLATRHLADHGARVIKVERPGDGDFARGYDRRVAGESSHFVWSNRSKESLALDLKHPAAQTILTALLPKVDVLVQNLAPGSTKRLGLSYADLCWRYPQLIVCDISGYGEGGPYADKKAYDLMVQSESGFLSVTGTADEVVKAGISIADIATGMYAYSSILAALLARQKNGGGRRIGISMLESMVEWMGYPLYYSFQGEPPPDRAGASHATIAPYGSFRTGDEQRVMLGLQNEREWQVFCRQVIKRPDLLDDPRFIDNSARSQHRAELKTVIEAQLADDTAAAVVERLELAGIANAQVRTMAEVWAHPQLAARQRWCQIASPRGDLPALIPPGFDSATPPRMSALPRLGEHTEAILSELGLADHIATWRQSGAIA